MPKAFPVEFRRVVVAVARKGEAPLWQIASDTYELLCGPLDLRGRQRATVSPSQDMGPLSVGRARHLPDCREHRMTIMRGQPNGKLRP